MNDKLKANFLPDKPWLESDYREIDEIVYYYRIQNTPLDQHRRE
jgi:hypothetical protein